MKICPLCKIEYDEKRGTICGDCDETYCCDPCYQKYLEMSINDDLDIFREKCGHHIERHRSVDIT